jgi:hypothetical protein
MSSENLLTEKNEVAIYEQIRSDLVLQSERVKIPLSMVFGRGTTGGNVQSFGGSTLVENTKKVDHALANVGELQSIWNHSHTQWMWKHLNLSWHAPMSNMRQIAAEIIQKRAALNEAKWRQVDLEIKIRKIEEELEKGNENQTLDYWRDVELKVKLAKYKEGIADGITMIEGAMKDVLVLNQLFEELKEKVSGFSEADVEKEETKSHLKRALIQSIRDVRMSGCITKAEQEYIEQIGINPMKLQTILRAYVEHESKQESWDVKGLYEFVDELTNELVDTYKVDKTRMNLQGFTSEVYEHFAQSEKLALLSKGVSDGNNASS